MEHLIISPFLISRPDFINDDETDNYIGTMGYIIYTRTKEHNQIYKNTMWNKWKRFINIIWLVLHLRHISRHITETYLCELMMSEEHGKYSTNGELEGKKGRINRKGRDGNKMFRNDSGGEDMIYDIISYDYNCTHIIL